MDPPLVGELYEQPVGARGRVRSVERELVAVRMRVQVREVSLTERHEMALRTQVAVQALIHEHPSVAYVEFDAAVAGAQRDLEAAVAANGALRGRQRGGAYVSRHVYVGT